MPNFETGESPRWIDISITLRNESETARHVLAELRRMHYDEATRTLEIDLKEPPPDPNAEYVLLRQVILPEFVVVAPNSDLALGVSVPELINRIRSFRPSAGGLDVEVLDVSELRQVKVAIAHSEAAFAVEKGASPESIRKRLADWGQVMEETVTPEFEGETTAGSSS